MTSIRKTKKALKREMRRIDSETNYPLPGVNDEPLRDCAMAYTNAWIVAYKESELKSLSVQCHVKSFHTKIMRKFRAMHESPKKGEIRQKLIEIRMKYGEPS